MEVAAEEAAAVYGAVRPAQGALAVVELLGIALALVLVAILRRSACQRNLHLAVARLPEAASALVLGAILRKK